MTSRIHDNDAFVTLIQVAQDDPVIKGQLVSILQLERRHREPLLLTFRDEMALRQKPKELIAAMSCLADDAVAARALAMLSPASGSMPSKPVLRIIKGLLSALIGGLTVSGMIGALLLCVNACVMSVRGLAGVIILTVAFALGAVVGMISLARASWYWILACIALCACIAWIIGATLL